VPGRNEDRGRASPFPGLPNRPGGDRPVTPSVDAHLTGGALDRQWSRVALPPPANEGVAAVVARPIQGVGVLCSGLALAAVTSGVNESGAHSPASPIDPNSGGRFGKMPIRSSMAQTMFWQTAIGSRSFQSMS